MASSELPSLPFELIGEILHRTPAESLIRFKSTCKKWYNLISDKRFMYNHLDNSPQRFLRIDNNESVQIMDPVTGIFSESPIPNVFRNTYTIYSMVHCDGLMLCICREQSDDANLAVWNPVLRKIKWIKPSDRYKPSFGYKPSFRDWYSDYFGIGYNNNTSRDDYKILRFWGSLSHCYRDDDKSDHKFEIKEVKSGSWRVIDAEFDGDLDTYCKGESVKGNMYWIAENNNQVFILCFDFSMETFKHICVSPATWGTKTLACFNGDRLSLLKQCFNVIKSREIEVWVTNKLSDGVVSFSKYFNVTSPDLPELQFHGFMARSGYSVGKHRNFMAWCEGAVKEDDDQWYVYIKFYEIDEGGIRKQIVTGRHREQDFSDTFICSYMYVPSLISIPCSEE